MQKQWNRVHCQPFLALLAEQHCAKTIFKMIRFASNKSNFYFHQQCSVALKYAKNALAAGAPPGPRWGSSRRSPVVGCGRGTPPPQNLLPSAPLARRDSRVSRLRRSFFNPSRTTFWNVPAPMVKSTHKTRFESSTWVVILGLATFLRLACIAT